MKKSALTLALASVMVLPLGSAHAAEGVINFIGEVTEATCSLAGPDANMNVRLGSYATNDINDNIGTYTEPVRFELRLTGCDPATATETANFTFQGGLAGQSAEILSLTGANVAGNLGIGIATTPGNFATAANRIQFDGQTEYPINNLVAGTNTLPLYAFYEKLTPADPVTPGPANGQVTFNVTYE